MGGFAIGLGGDPGAASSALGRQLSQVAALREAAAQQQKLADQQRLEQFNTEIKMRQDGYQPAENPTGGTLATGLGQRNPAPDANATNTVTDPFGRRWYKPQAAAKPDMTLNEALSKGGQPLDANGQTSLGVSQGPQLDANDPAAVGQSLLDRLNGSGDNRVTPPAERVATVENGKKVYLPSEQETEGNKERVDRSKGQAEHDSQQFTLPDPLASKLEDHAGLPAGTLKGLSIPRSELRALLTSLADKKADAKQLLSGYASKAGNPLQLDKNTGEVSEIQLPAGAKKELTPGQQETQQRFQDRQQDRKDAADQRRRDAGQKQIDSLQQKEQAQHEQRKLYGDALNTPNGQPLVDPDTRKQVVMSPTRRQFYQNRYQKATDMVEIHQAQQRTVARSMRGETASNTPTPSGESQQPQRPVSTTVKPAAAKQGRGALTDPKIAQNYLQKAKGNKAVARKLAKADGWEF